jgi:hypothetical protein
LAVDNDQCKYRLPTGPVGIRRARRTTTKYWWGGQPEAGKAACKGCRSGYVGDQPMRLACCSERLRAFDMTGSIDQWVSDCWNRNYVGAPSDGRSWDRPIAGGMSCAAAHGERRQHSRTSSRNSYILMYLSHARTARCPNHRRSDHAKVDEARRVGRGALTMPAGAFADIRAAGGRRCGLHHLAARW